MTTTTKTIALVRWDYALDAANQNHLKDDAGNVLLFETREEAAGWAEENGLVDCWRGMLRGDEEWQVVDTTPIDHDNHDAITACMKAHDRLVDDAGDATSTGDKDVFDAFWAALKPAVSQGTYDAIVDDCAQNNNTSWRVLPMIASEWVSWL